MTGRGLGPGMRRAGAPSNGMRRAGAPSRRLGAAALAMGLLLALPAHAASEPHAASGPTPVSEPNPAPEPRDGADHAVPLYGELLRPWDAPHDNPFAPGHRGIDIEAPLGSDVRASAQGLVLFAGVVVGNRTVTLDHGEGLWTTYSFLDEIHVSAGQDVLQGQVLGTVGGGHPGAELGPHVHLSARLDGVYFDPIVLYVGNRLDDLVALVA